MRFFFPDSQDQIDPTFDFVTERRSPFRVRQRDDRYAHEALKKPPYDGILVSKSIVDGSAQGAGKYTLAQRHRLYRLGVRRFFRLDDARNQHLSTMGDCGAFSYVNDEEPPYSVAEVLGFYEECGFDYGMSVDHVVLGFRNEQTEGLPGIETIPSEWIRRRELTLQLAADFIDLVRSSKARVRPVGVAQGWSPASYAASVEELQHMGYRNIALGGLAALRTRDILLILRAVDGVRQKRRTQLHLLGVTRCEQVNVFAGYGVTSFDSTSPFRQAFKDETDNYYMLDRTYTALRVPQVEANVKFKARIMAGEVDQDQAVKLERRCLTKLVEFDNGRASARNVVKVLHEYEQLHDGKKDRSALYLESMEARPWKQCGCGICESVGIQVMIFRGTERNKRRGFHNVHVFADRLERELARGTDRKATHVAV